MYWWYTIFKDLQGLKELCIQREKYVDELEEENKNLNIKVASLEWEIKWLNSVIDKLREELSAYDREYFDEDKKAKNIFIDKSWKVIKGWEFTTLC